MNPIKFKMRRLQEDADELTKDINTHDNAVIRLKKERAAIYQKMINIRRDCKHDYGDQRVTSMGKGICKICGNNDY